jgi:hypothetical protein
MSSHLLTLAALREIFRPFFLRFHRFVSDLGLSGTRFATHRHKYGTGAKAAILSPAPEDVASRRC